MAASSRLVPRAQALNEVTNDSFETQAHHHSENRAEESLRRFLRRKSPIPLSGASTQSSDSPELPHDEIYNADRVLSQEYLSRLEHSLPEAMWLRPPTGPDNHTTSASPVLSLPLSPRDPLGGSPIPHSNWPRPELDAVLEDQGTHSIRSSRSLPRLSSSPERKSRVVCPQISIRSIHALESSIERTLPPSIVTRRRSLSQNDADDLPTDQTNRAWHQSSSESTDRIRVDGGHPEYPAVPVTSPPYRAPTPPGLPTFGTPEALAYRLDQSHHSSRSLWNRLWRRSDDELDDQLGSGGQSIASPPNEGSASMSPSVRPASPPGELLKRTLAMIGMARVVEPAPTPSRNPRSSLPPGIHTSSQPGYLARADDGTYVRGRFGPRTSGHGIGSRHLEAHPLSRRTRLGAIEEQVREIDKACEHADTARAVRESLSMFHGGIGEIRRESRQLGPRGMLSPDIVVTPPTAATSPSRSDRDNRAWGPLPSTWQSGHLFSTGLGHPSMRGPPPYPPPFGSFSGRSEISVVPISEVPERARTREMVLSEKRKEQRSPLKSALFALDDCSRDCWQWCCVNREAAGGGRQRVEW